MEKLEHTPMSDNKLIDQFMEAKPVEDIPYDTDWNLLMPVVEKIEEIEGIRFIIEKNRVLITGIEYFWNSGTTSETKLTTTYNAVVEFIKWHNSEKLKLKQP